MDRYVYHGSATRGMTKLVPHASTHGTEYVYAMKNATYAVAFLGGVDDFHVAKEFAGDRLEITERYVDAMSMYRNAKGSVYKVHSDSFVEGATSWDAEVVSTVPVQVIEEIHINDVYVFLFREERRGLVRIYRYPNRPEYIPEDDSDLIEKAVIFASWEGNEESTCERFMQYHRHHAQRFEQLLRTSDIQKLSGKHEIPLLTRKLNE